MAIFRENGARPYSHTERWFYCYLTFQVHTSLRIHQGKVFQCLTYHYFHQLEVVEAGEEDSDPMIASISGLFVTKFPWCWVTFGSKVLQGDTRGSNRAHPWFQIKSGVAE